MKPFTLRMTADLRAAIDRDRAEVWADRRTLARWLFAAAKLILDHGGLDRCTRLLAGEAEPEPARPRPEPRAGLRSSTFALRSLYRSVYGPGHNRSRR